MSGPTLALRPSRMPLAVQCLASHHPAPDEVLIEIIGDDESAALGQAAHEAMAAVVEDRPLALDEIAARYRVDRKDLGFLTWAGRDLWERIRENATDWIAEAHLAPDDPVLGLTGTADAVGTDASGTAVTVVDFKTGRVDRDYSDQMRAYAWLAACVSPAVQGVTAAILWLRAREVQAWTWTADELRAWAERTRAAVWGWDGRSYTVGEHCTWCLRHATCVARRAEMDAGMELILYPKADMESATFARVWRASVEIPKAIEQWRQRQKEEVLALGPKPMGDGKSLVCLEQNGPPEIDAGGAMRFLREAGWAEEEITSCLSVGVTALKDAAANRIDRGQKGAARKQIVEDLETAGALVPTKRRVLKIVDAEAAAGGGKEGEGGEGE